MEIDRIRREYRRRDRDGRLSARYEDSGPGARFLADRREAVILRTLRAELAVPVHAVRLLDLGCGAGHDLPRFRALGVRGSALVGFDLLSERLDRARRCCPQPALAQGDAGHLPFADSTFDVVFQSMVFTSILDAGLRKAAAAEMRRVLKSDGLILWYDFWWNPRSRATKGIGLPALRRLFPRCGIEARRATLAPPLARIVAPITARGARALEAIPWLRTHYCAVIRPDAATPDMPRRQSGRDV